jgi:hypothetical protein
MFPKILVEVVAYLNSVDIPISKKRDGRLASTEDEDTVFDLLVKKFGIENVIREPKTRWWWDYNIFGNVINFKSSTYCSADNFSSKGAILYALTNLPDKEIDKMNSCGWKKFQSTLKNNYKEGNDKDYHIISLNKITNEVHLSSLKTLDKIVPNGSNLPFQIKWGDNLKSVQRTDKEAYEFLVECYKKSVFQKINAHDGFEDL